MQDNPKYVDWTKTWLGENRVKESGFYEERESDLGRREGFFKDRLIIGRDTRINGGVYLGGSAREAIVVDDKKDASLDRIYQALLERRRKAEQEQGKAFKDGILEEVWDLVNQVMPFDKNNVEKVVATLTEPDAKIALSRFIGGGVCRHQALLTGYLLERLSNEGRVGGKVSVDRNYVPGKGGHAWVRYTNSIGAVYILDSAQKYIGALKDMDPTKERWFYERPEDLKT